MKRPKCPYGKLKVPIGRRVCKRKPGRRASPGGSRHGPRAQPPYPQAGRLDRPEVNDLFQSRPVAVIDHRMLWDDGSAMDLPL